MSGFGLIRTYKTSSPLSSLKLKETFARPEKRLCVSRCSFANIKPHRLGCLNNRDVLAHTSGDQKSHIKVPAGLISSEGESFCASLLASAGWLAGNPWCFVACRCITPLDLCLPSSHGVLPVSLHPSFPFV